jgi:MFS family permease
MNRSAAQAFLVGLGTAVVPLDTAVNIAFPAITRGFALATADIQWVVICYVLTYTALTLALGRIGDIYGHARVFRAGLLWSTVALALCALAPSFPTLLLARFLQGIGAALILSCGAALAIAAYGEPRRSRALGLYTTMFAAGLTLGPWVGGALVEAWDWPAVFAFRVPIAALALLLSRGLPAPAPAAGTREPFDFLGAVLLAAALTAMLLTFNRSGELAAVPLGIVALAVFAAFFRHEARSKNPIIDPAVFRLPGFAVLNLSNVLINVAAFSVWLLVPFYLTRSTDLPLAASGAILATGSLGMAIASSIAGRLAGRIPTPRLALAGAILAGVGLLLIATWQRGTPAAWLVATLLLQSAGLGVFQLAYTDIVTATIPPQHRGVAGSLAMVTRTVGTVSAAALVMLLFAQLETGSGFLPAFRQSFALAGLVPLAIAGLLALRRAK